MPSLLPPLQQMKPSKFDRNPDFDTELQKLPIDAQAIYRATTLPKFMTSHYSSKGIWIRN